VQVTVIVGGSPAIVTVEDQDMPPPGSVQAQIQALSDVQKDAPAPVIQQDALLLTIAPGAT
jgi:hypothetical protein